METNNNTSRNLSYNFIAVPTQLFILLDYRLKLVLTSLIQVSTALANSEGWFYYSIDDLKKLCGLKSDKTVRACLETFYRLQLLEVKSKTFQNNIGKRTANYYRINFNEIEKYNEYSVYECMNIKELQIPMLDYTSDDYKTTYTASTEVEDSSDKSSTIVEKEETEELPINVEENVVETQEMASEEEIVETSSVIPTDTNKIEYRNFLPKETDDKSTNAIGKCYDLVNRYCEMDIPNSNKSLEMCNSASLYIRSQFEKGLLPAADKERLLSVLIRARFKKHPI